MDMIGNPLQVKPFEINLQEIAIERHPETQEITQKVKLVASLHLTGKYAFKGAAWGGGIGGGLGLGFGCWYDKEKKWEYCAKGAVKGAFGGAVIGGILGAQQSSAVFTQSTVLNDYVKVPENNEVYNKLKAKRLSLN